MADRGNNVRVDRLWRWLLLWSVVVVQAIMLSTHSMEEAQAVGKRVAIMTGGHMQCVGTPRELHVAYGFGYELEVGQPVEGVVGSLVGWLAGWLVGVALPPG